MVGAYCGLPYEEDIVCLWQQCDSLSVTSSVFRSILFLTSRMFHHVYRAQPRITLRSHNVSIMAFLHVVSCHFLK